MFYSNLIRRKNIPGCRQVNKACKRKVTSQTTSLTRLENYVDDFITQLGTGEAFISNIDEKGSPTGLAHTLIRPDFSPIHIPSDQESKQIEGKSLPIRIR